MRIILTEWEETMLLAIVEGAVKAAEEIDDEIFIIGIEDIINEELKKYKYDENGIRVLNADEVISNQEHRSKR